MLKLLARYLLLIGAVLGLSSQSVASASTPCLAMSSAQGSAMDMPDCAPMAAIAKSKLPAKHMMPGCMAMAGCVAVVAFEAPAFQMAAPLPLMFAATWDPSPVLSGRDIAPDPDPPALLG